MEGGSPSEAGVPLIDAGSITTTTSERIQVVASVHKQVMIDTVVGNWIITSTYIAAVGKKMV